MGSFQPCRDDPLRPGTAINPRAEFAWLLLRSHLLIPHHLLLFLLFCLVGGVTLCENLHYKAQQNSLESIRILAILDNLFIISASTSISERIFKNKTEFFLKMQMKIFCQWSLFESLKIQRKLWFNCQFHATSESLKFQYCFKPCIKSSR